MSQLDHQTPDDPKPLLSFPSCPICNRKRRFGGVPGVEWIACGGCGGIGSTREAMAAAEKQFAVDHRAWRERRRVAQQGEIGNE